MSEMTDAMAPIWVYDGSCGFCSAAAAHAARHEKSPIRYVAIQSRAGRALALAHGVDPDDPATFLFIEAGIAHRGAAAMIALSRRLNGPARAIGWLRFAPGPLREGAYRLLARHRYRIFGRRDACMAPAPEARDRFVLPDRR